MSVEQPHEGLYAAFPDLLNDFCNVNQLDAYK